MSRTTGTQVRGMQLLRNLCPDYVYVCIIKYDFLWADFSLTKKTPGTQNLKQRT